jgi:predicted dienelactone hydrolase
MRHTILAVILASFTLSVFAGSPPFHAAVTRLTVQDATAPIDTAVFYPTETPETPWRAGPFTVDASRDAPLIDNRSFPVVLLSHGRGGGPLSHRELAIALARDGFVVVVPTHVGDASGFPAAKSQAQILIDRPRQAEEALNAVLSNPHFAPHLDANRIGMIGYSAGGYTALILAGAQPDFAYANQFCATHDDAGSCGHRRTTEMEAASSTVASSVLTVSPELAVWHPPIEPRLKALVLMDPLAVMFNAQSFAAIRIPILLYRPQSDTLLSAPRNALAVASGLPVTPQQQIVPGSHFVFIDPCPSQIAADAPLICQDPPGVDRPAIHRQIENQVVNFLHAHL